jgi:hypothetical protein
VAFPERLLHHPGEVYLGAEARVQVEPGQQLQVGAERFQPFGQGLGSAAHARAPPRTRRQLCRSARASGSPLMRGPLPVEAESETKGSAPGRPGTEDRGHAEFRPGTPARVQHVPDAPIACHPAALSWLLNRKLRLDPFKEEFLGDDEANGLRALPSQKVL